MKISFPTVISHSGSDVFFELLAGGLAQHGIATESIHLSHRHEFIPLLSAKERQAIAAGDIIHTAVEHGSLVFTPGRPLALTALHNVMDPAYQQYTSPAQKLFHRLIIHPRQRRSLQLASAVICISEATRRSYAEMYPECADKIKVVYPGVDLRRFRGSEVKRLGGSEIHGSGGSTGDPVSVHPRPSAVTSSYSSPQSEIGNRKSAFSILFVGHMTRRKGADLLLPIMEGLGLGYELICAGQRNTMASESTTPSGAVIRMLPLMERAKLVELYNNCDLLLFPSRLEGFGYAVAEAMACGKPVVATNASSIPELIDHEKGGILCSLDNVEAFASGIQSILADKNKAMAMGSYNRAKAERMFSMERMVKEHLEIYKKIIPDF